MICNNHIKGLVYYNGLECPVCEAESKRKRNGDEAGGIIVNGVRVYVCPEHNCHYPVDQLCPECWALRPKARMTTDSDKRKELPIATGCLDYFPDALAAVAELSHVGNAKHNPGQELHWNRSKSTDEPDCLLRHFMERGTIDTDGVRHSVKVAWRALAILQKELEVANGLPISRGSRSGVTSECQSGGATSGDAYATSEKLAGKA